MDPHFLSQDFDGIAFKRLSAVEAHPHVSNQHEFNGGVQLRELLGVARQKFPAEFVYLSDNRHDVRSATGFVTWYDAREAHPSRSEHRLYFPTTTVSDRIEEGDLAIFARRRDGSILVAIADQGSAAENRLLRLFNLPTVKIKFQVRALDRDSRPLGLAVSQLLEQLGIRTQGNSG